MRARLSALVALAVLAAGSARAFDLTEIRKRGTLRVLAVVSREEDYFVSQKPGMPPGFDLEVIEGFAKLNGLKVEVVRVSRWDALIPSLSRESGDLIAGGFTDTDSRRAQIDFTTEVFPTRSVVMTRRPGAVIKSIEDLKTRKVGTIKGTAMEEELAAAGITDVDASITAGGLPLALKTGRIEAAADGLEAALTARTKDPDIQCGVFLGPPSSLAYGVRKNDRELRDELNKYIANMRRTSTWSRLVVKYFGEASLDILKKARAQ